MSHQDYLDYMSPFFKSVWGFEEFSASINTPLLKSFSCVQSRGSVQTTIVRLQSQWFSVQKSDYNPLNYKVNKEEDEKTIALGKTPEHILGQLYIQETAASLPASIIPLPMEWNILDMCAAPGGKTTQLADRCKIIWSKAVIRANEPDSKRIIPLASNLTRTGMQNVVTIQHDGSNFWNHVPEFFDSILLDAPCSGEGTGFKSDFGTKFWDVRKVESIAKVQQQLLISAFKACKVWGTILYSTCTSNPLENEANVQLLMEKYPEKLELEEIKIDWLSAGLEGFGEISTYSKRLRPHLHHTWGFFMCLLKKTWGIEETFNQTQYKQKSKGVMKAKFIACDRKPLVERLHKNYEITVPDHIQFSQSQNQIYAHNTLDFAQLNQFKIDKPGLLVIKGDKPSSRRVTHGAGLLFDFASHCQVHLDEKQVTQHINQQDIDLHDDQIPSQSATNYVQLYYAGNKAWVGKIIWNSIKNKLTGVF